MNSVERVKSLCKEKKIPISRLERDLGYSNGYIGQLRKGVFPTDRLVEIANYLNVSIDYLLSGEKKEAPSATAGSERSEIDAILDELSPDNRAKLTELARLYLDAQRKNEESK